MKSFLAFLLACVMALLGQILLDRWINLSYAPLLYGVGIVSALWAFRAPQVLAAEPGVVRPGLVPGRAVRLKGVILLMAALIPAMAAAWLLSRGWESNVDRAMPFYGLALLLALLGIGLLEGWHLGRMVSGARAYLSRHRVPMMLLGAILVLALFLRLHRLDYYPPPGGISWNDEAQIGKDAHAILTTGARPWQFPLLVYPAALSFHLLGETVLALRLVPILLGFVTLIVFYLLAQELFGQGPALAGTFLFAVSRWHISFTKLLVGTTPGTLLEVTTFYFILRGLRTRGRSNYIWAGLSLSLGLYGHASFKIVPALVVILFLTRAIPRVRHLVSLSGRGRWRALRHLLADHYQGLLIFLASFLLFSAPYLALVGREPRLAFTERFTSIMPVLFNPSQGRDWGAVVEKTKALLLFFNYKGEMWGAINLPGLPMLDTVTGSLFVLGLACCLFFFWRDDHLFLLTWFSVTLIGGGAFVDIVRSHRFASVLPVIYLFICVLVRQGWQEFRRAFGPRRHAWSFLPLSLVLAIAAWLNYDTFFNRQIHDSRVRIEFDREIAAVANYIASLGKGYYIYLFANYPFYVQGHDFAWMAGEPAGRRAVDIGAVVPNRDETPLDIAYIFSIPYDGQSLAAVVRHVYPGATVESFPSQYGHYSFVSALVSNDEVMARRGLMARYWSDREGDGGPVVERRDLQIEFDWHLSKPPLAPPFQVEWRGSLYVPVQGQYAFVLEGDGEGRTFVDGNLVESEKTVPLVQGWHGLQVRYASGPRPRVVRLLWQRADGIVEGIPATHLSTLEGPEGWLASYYRGSGWGEGPVLKRIEPVVAMVNVPSHWNGAPLEVLQGQPFSVEWDGWLKAERQGFYTFVVEAWSGEAELYVDEVMMLEVTGQPNVRSQRAEELELAEGLHHVMVRYSFLEGEFNGLKLRWAPPGQPTEVIGPAYVRPFTQTTVPAQ
ncbi:MAG: PA14 domain-containing protein [Anaerolineae bacterium]